LLLKKDSVAWNQFANKQINSDGDNLFKDVASSEEFMYRRMRLEDNQER
jgi:hypothetical protein